MEEKRDKKKVEKDNADMNTNVHMYSIYTENVYSTLALGREREIVYTCTCTFIHVYIHMCTCMCVDKTNLSILGGL